MQTGLRTILSEEGLTVRIYYLECLAQATYLVAHDGCAFIVDPRRDVDAFLEVRRNLLDWFSPSGRTNIFFFKLMPLLNA